MIGTLLFVSDKRSHIIYTYERSSKELKLLVGKIGESRFIDGPSSTSPLTLPVGVVSRGSTFYIAESPSDINGQYVCFQTWKDW